MAGMRDGVESAESGECEKYFASGEQRAATGGGWTAMRYHCDGERLVSDMLSFDSVFGINPFEVGARRAGWRRGYRARKDAVFAALEIKPLLRRPFDALSNGEMRRVLLARALLKGPARIEVRDPFGGFDPDWRARMLRLGDALRPCGTEIALAGAAPPLPAGGGAWTRRGRGAPRPPIPDAKAVVEMRGVHVSFGGRVLFKDFSWTVREGERWTLRGPNGSGKTTLLALITGDSPLSHAFDIRVFGKRRGDEGVVMQDVRRRIGVVSAERETMLGIPVEDQMDAALAARTRLLLLDEPCCNLSPARARRALARAADWLDAHPKAAAVCVAHSPAHVPAGFGLELSLPRT